jgi:rod shape-determining protein MreC
VVSIITYRDERKLFAVIGAIIIAALIALVQVQAARSGRPGALGIAAQSIAVWFQSAVALAVGSARSSVDAVVSLPQLAHDNAELRAELHALKLENHRLTEQLAQEPDAAALLRAQLANPQTVAARVVGYDPEGVEQTVILDHGSHSGIHPGAGVITDEGIVGRVAAVTPFAATVQLVTDGSSKIPAVIQRGRWWGIATGVPQSTQIALEYISQDAKLRVGDVVVTGEGRSFHAGWPIGRVVKIYFPQGALYQTAVVAPSAGMSKLDRVLVFQSNQPAR